MSVIKNVSGILAIDKPEGISSFDVIRQLKKFIRVKKIGHGGTLDPFASGVLLILIGEATKAFDYLLKSEKQYLATLQFGASTDTDDLTGDTISRSEDKIARSDLENILPDFTGDISQVPPLYSALKINGKRSYDLARNNQKVHHASRIVTIHELVIESFDPESQTASLRISCGSGTYIRSLARDMGRRLSVGAFLTGLRRLRSGGVDSSDCVNPDNLNEDNWIEHLIPLNQALSFYPELICKEERLYILNGRPLHGEIIANPPQEDGIYRLIAGGKFCALISYEKGSYKYLRVFQET